MSGEGRGHNDRGAATHLHRFTCSTVEAAPPSAGIYAWYSVLDAGRADWEAEIGPDGDAGRLLARDLLKRHSERHQPPPLNVEVQGRFSARWRGKLDEERSGEVAAALSMGSDGGAPRVQAPKLQATLDSPSMREALIRILATSSPFFAAPLYIGVAESLSQRLQQHVRQLRFLWDKCSHDPLFLDNIEATKRANIDGTFAGRAVSRGFSPEKLEVWALNIESLARDRGLAGDPRVVSEACEWLLNRWHRPQLGRR